MHDPHLSRLIDTLRTQHQAHAIILYGSHADGSAGPDSDYDLAAFAPVTQLQRDNAYRDGIWHDLFIYPLTTLQQADSSLFKLRGGVVLHDRDGQLATLLTQLDALHAAGPAPLCADERAVRVEWSHKMLQRLQRGDDEGHYRRVWLLTTLLEDYFALRGLWFDGPKKALRWLAREQADHAAAFSRALTPAASSTDIAALVAVVTEMTVISSTA